MNTVELPSPAQALLAQARVAHTPCGDGALAWHLWGEGPPVVLLHGGSGSWTHWVRNIPALVAAGFQVVVPDLPGFGDSAVPPGGEDADVSVAPLAEGLRALVPGPLRLVGFSFGTLVAVLLAARTPRVQQLVLLGAPVFPLASGRGVPLQEWRHLATEEERSVVHAHNLRAIMLHRPESVTREALALQALNVTRDRMRRRRLVTTSLLADTLGALACPTWLAYGREDALCRDCWDELAARVRAMPPVRELHGLPGVGHWVQYEAPDEIDRYLLQVFRTGAAA
jgi:2-hydroxy-6-oxonona-2,4-dienedioate hydrolase